MNNSRKIPNYNNSRQRQQMLNSDSAVETESDRDHQQLTIASPQSAPPSSPLTQLTLSQLLINMKNTIMGIPLDLITEGFNTQVFTRDNRLFYLGLFLILIFIIYLIIWNLTRFPCPGKPPKCSSILMSKGYDRIDRSGCISGICPMTRCGCSNFGV